MGETEGRQTPNVVVTHLTAVLPDGDESLSRGDKAIQSVMEGMRSIRGLTRDASIHVGNKITLRASDPRIPSAISEQLTHTSHFAVMAGLDLLERARLISEEGQWQLEESTRDGTGIIFASSFEHHEACIRAVRYAARRDELQRVRTRLSERGICGEEVEAALAELEEEVHKGNVRKVALFLLLGANVQLAQIVKARGLNTFVTCACASTTAALSLASSVLRAGDAKRMVVVACDTLLQPDTDVVVESFVRLKAASTATTVEDAVRPFSEGRSGFVLGDGAVALLLESKNDVVPYPDDVPSSSTVEILASRVANSAFHGTRLDSGHIAHVLKGCVQESCEKTGLTLEEFAQRSVYFSHETFTPACSNVEVEALEAVFGRELLRKVTIVGTKGSTGHMMGAGMEDVVSVYSLAHDALPNMYIPDIDPKFADLCFHGQPREDAGREDAGRDDAGREDAGREDEPQRNSEVANRFAIHLAAGLGSHIAVVVYHIVQ
jgi:3-oxoacyl-(acyl-carrier-protein) synthase